MADTLTIEELGTQLASLAGWSVDGNAITKMFTFDDFKAAVKFFNQVAAVAQQRDHHPDIEVRYDRVKISLSTHSAGGVTKQDIGLAKLIDEVGL